MIPLDDIAAHLLRPFDGGALQPKTRCWMSGLSVFAPHDDVFWSLLDPTETVRARAFIRDEDQLRFIRAHGLLRCLLGEVTGQVPDRLGFTNNEHGKPELDLPDPLHFSLSTSEDQLVIATCETGPVGVDVECMKPIDVPLMLPMVRHETDDVILDLDKAERLKAFFRLWTGKEAILKAIGTGFQVNPREIDLGEGFLIGTTQTAQVTAFSQSFDLVCEETPTAMVSLALSSRPA